MIDFLEKLLVKFKDPLEVDMENAAEIFRERKEDEILAAEEKAEKLANNAQEKIDAIEKTVEEIEEFQDEKGRKAVDDIVDNLVKDRKKVIQNFSLGGDPYENLEEIREFVTDFQAMKRKEAAVLGMTSKQEELGRHMKELQETGQQLEQHLEKEYSIVEDADSIEQKLEKIREKREKIGEMQEELFEIGLDRLDEKAGEKRMELEEYRKGDQMQAYRNLKERLEDRKNERDEIVQEIENNASKMRRGLKKLIYSAENSELELEKLDTLKQIKNAETQKLLERPETVEVAVEQLNEKGDISDVQRQKLLEGVEHLSNLTEHVERIDEIGKKTYELESKIEAHPAPKKLEKIRQEKEKLVEQLEAEESRKEKLKQDTDKLETEIEGLEQDIREIFRDSFRREVKFE